MDRQEQFLFAKLILLILTKIYTIVSLGKERCPKEIFDTSSEEQMINLLFKSEEEK